MAGDVNIDFQLTGDIFVEINRLQMEFEALTKQVTNLTGDATKGFNRVSASIDNTNTQLKRTSDGVRILAMQAATELYQGLAQPFQEGARAMYDFDTSLRELGALTGETGTGLERLGAFARDSAKEFGGDAASHLKTFQLLLSELTPELADKPEALKQMSDWANTLALTMGGDTAGATRALNAAMNQFGVNLDDPIQAAAIMRDMMNQMGAAAQAGSVDVPDIATALNQVGSAAKAAGLDFATTNAALQVLGKAGKKGSEGGVALRNVLRIMARDDFMPKEVADRMRAYGVNLELLSDPTVSFRDRLIELRKISSDGTLISGLFGENEIAGRALITNVNLLDDYTTAIVSNKTATEDMAETIAGSLENRRSRIIAFFNDIRLSIMDTFGGTLPYVETFISGMGGVIQLAPGIAALRTLLAETTLGIKLQAFWTKIIAGLTKGWAFVTRGLGVAFRFMMGPVGWIIGAIALVSAGVMYAWNNFEGFRAAIYGIWEAVKQVFGNVAKFIGDMLQPFFDAVKFIMDGQWGKAAVALGKGLLNIATTPFQFAKSLVSGDITEGVGDAYARGDAAGRASFQSDQKEKDTTIVEAPGLEKLLQNDASNGATPSKNASGLDELLKGGVSNGVAQNGTPTGLLGNLEKNNTPKATGTGTSGGGRMVSTRIEQLVGTLNVYVQGGVADFEQKVRDAVNTALIGAVRDSEIALS